MNVFDRYDLAQRELDAAKKALKEWFDRAVERAKTEAELQQFFDRLPWTMRTNGTWYFALQKVKTRKVTTEEALAQYDRIKRNSKRNNPRCECGSLMEKIGANTWVCKNKKCDAVDDGKDLNR